jgi:hypothetical protein
VPDIATRNLRVSKLPEATVWVRVAPVANIGTSVDRGHTSVELPSAMQSATLDAIQFGFDASVVKAPWTRAASALVHGLGRINSSRDTGFGIADAGYNARRDRGIDQSRILPKAANRICAKYCATLQSDQGPPWYRTQVVAGAMATNDVART